jgi:integrase
MASLFKRGKQFWVSFYLGGQHVRKSLETNVERIAAAKLKQLEYELSTSQLHVASRLPLTQVLEAFCRHLMATRTYKSWKNDFSRLRIFFGPLCEALKPGTPGVLRNEGSPKATIDRYADKHVQAELLEDVTPQLINRFLSERFANQGWAPKTANLMRLTLHRLFAYAIKHYGFVSHDRRYPNPAAGVDRFKEPAPDIRFLTLRQIEEQLEAVREHQTIHVLVATYIYAGLRREEATWLTYEDVDMDQRLLRIRAKTINDESWQPKTKRNRVVPISDALFAVLAAYRPAHQCVWFFPSPTGKRWDVDNFSQDLAAINKEHGLSWTCLDFRHTFGSQLAQKGESLYKIATLMGNSPEICRKHYAALIPEEMADVVEFGKPDGPGPNGDTKAMLKAILEKLEAGDEKVGRTPTLRIVRASESA